MTAVYITVIIAAALVINSIVIAARDVAKAKSAPAPRYPHQDGNHTVLGPEIFTDSSGDVICWKGANYVRQDSKEKSA